MLSIDVILKNDVRIIDFSCGTLSLAANWKCQFIFDIYSVLLHYQVNTWDMLLSYISTRADIELHHSLPLPLAC